MEMTKTTKKLVTGLVLAVTLAGVGLASGTAPAGAHARQDPCPGKHNETIYPASQYGYGVVDANGNDIVCINRQTGFYRDDR